MKIAVVAPEAAPLARTGGLGDVVGALPRWLARAGHTVKVFLPGYGMIDRKANGYILQDDQVFLDIGGTRQSLTFSRNKDRRLPLEHYLLENDFFFDRESLYVDPKTGRDYPDNDDRFQFLCRGALMAMRMLDFQPDIIHLHDWQTALVPAYLRSSYDDNFFAETKTVLTIHNLAYQGTFPMERHERLGLPVELFAPTSPFEFYGKINFLKGGLMFADQLTTVSKTYAREIQTTPELGCGLEGVLRGRSADLVGIVNGVDYTVWSPSRDANLPYNYHRANLGGKRSNKVELLNEIGLPLREHAPLMAVVTRLVEQKGIDLVIEIADRLLKKNVQLIVLGTGDKEYQRKLSDIADQYEDKMRVYFKFDDVMAHKIEAAADIFLMPSRFEPCGLNQMYSLKYGTIPVVRHVGGLADTVIDYDEATGSGTGFVFDESNGNAFYKAIERAMTLFARKREWKRLMKQAMAVDNSWKNAATNYERMFAGVTRHKESDVRA